jgi:hypothetical protein
MVKKVLTNSGAYISTALVVLGWAAFCGIYLSSNPVMSFILMAIARVLP